MATTSDNPVDREVAFANAKRIYDEVLLPRYIDTHRHRYVAIDGVSGDYEIQENDPWALDRLLKKHPEAVIFSKRIGSKTHESFESLETPMNEAVDEAI